MASFVTIILKILKGTRIHSLTWVPLKYPFSNLSSYTLLLLASGFVLPSFVLVWKRRALIETKFFNFMYLCTSLCYVDMGDGNEIWKSLPLSSEAWREKAVTRGWSMRFFIPILLGATYILETTAKLWVTICFLLWICIIPMIFHCMSPIIILLLILSSGL